MSLLDDTITTFINKSYQKILDLGKSIGKQSYVDSRVNSSLDLANDLQDAIEVFQNPNLLADGEKIYIIDKLTAKACLNDYNYTLLNNRFVTFVNASGNGSGSGTSDGCCEYVRHTGSKFKVGGLNIGFIPTGIVMTLDEILFGNIPPSIALNASPLIVEKAKANLSIALTYNITTNDGIVASRSLKRNATVINTPVGNLGSFTDTGQKFTSPVDYGFLVTYSNYGTESVIQTVRPYAPTFYGCLSDAVTPINGARIQSIMNAVSSPELPKSIIAPQDLINIHFSPAQQKYVLAEPQSAGLRVNIRDQNGSQVFFFLLSSFTLTLSDGVVTEPYYLYISPSLVSLPTGTSSISFSFYRN